MPKVKMSEAEEQRCFLGRVIKSNMERNDVTCEKLLKTAGISRSTHFKRIRDPDSMTLGELKIYVRMLKISDSDLLYALKGEKG